MRAGDAQRPREPESLDASVIVGLVNGGLMIDALLVALARQRGDVAFEVVVASRCRDGTAQRIAEKYPDIVLLDADAGTTLPELRTLAFERARGRTIFVTEDHTVPPLDWIESFVTALDRAAPNVVAVGGPVDNAMRERATDWAAFLCEYSGYLPPQAAGETDDLPGMNIAYRREILDEADRDELSKGFWESTVHARVLAAGKTFLRVPGTVIEHRKSFGFRYFMAQRFHYSRHFAGTRFLRTQRARRLLYAVVSLALPALVLLRVSKRVLRRPPYRRPLLRAAPALACFVVAWGLGETVGYLLGPGSSLAEIE